MRETESILQQFGEYLLQRRLVREREAPHCVRWVRRFLSRPATDEPPADRVRRFCEELEGGCADWQVRQAEQALGIYFRQFLGRTDWLEPAAAKGKRGPEGVEPLGTVEQLRRRVKTRRYSYRTEKTYCDWVRRSLEYLAEQQATKRPVVDSQAVQGFLTHLATRRHVSASTQNQALSAVLFLCRHVLGVEVGGLSRAIQAKRGTRLPVVLSVSETAACSRQ